MSRSAVPKQFLHLTGEGTMAELTARRARGDRFARPVVVASETHAQRVEQQLGGEDIEFLVLEPAPRNTAAAIAAAALLLPRDELLLVLPSDHYIRDEQIFRDAVLGAAPFAADGWIVTFGIRPSRPETGFGYIKVGEQLGAEIFRADRFLEKPDLATAQSFCDAGTYYWNGGIFLFRAGDFLDQLAQHAPEILNPVSAAVAGARREGVRISLDGDSFAAAPSISIDYAVMEKSDRVAVVPLSVGWSDVGSWEALHDLLPKDHSGNAITGDVVANGTTNCLIRSQGRLVAAIGVSDLVIVEMDDVVLVMSREASQDLKTTVEQIREAKRDALL
jgi:mannose-1-phosphate guanylyltransferase/mannose-1-phosphate guanylyltransferase/mannose-6-phosphate isomerase